ncbi:MAG: VWA domain-containing protein [Prevotella sp.]|jgi:Mg-chelatase subunit ChlD|nr:VWA domain-containing protein [Prevotella sp.]
MEKRIFNLIIVDESGSMSVIERQALEGMNETLETVQKMQEQHKEMEQRVTLITFDSTHTKFIYDNAAAAGAPKLSPKDYNPGGATPLYDAIGIGISKVNALTSADDRVLVTIITDGEENCSQEYNLKMIKNLVEKLKKQNWTFTFIGTDNLDVEGTAGAMGINNHFSFAEDAEGTREMFRCERECRSRYNDRVASNKEDADGYFDSDK